ncbi:hypothetical protein CGRA01v4_03304 [Colletotrichum graminicola]|nr:hypothetical protein CGRA01v4_03304 [Colletotrichum graminicola]
MLLKRPRFGELMTLRTLRVWLQRKIRHSRSADRPSGADRRTPRGCHKCFGPPASKA